MSKSRKTGKTAGPKSAAAALGRRARSNDDRLDALQSAFEPLSLWRTLSAHQFTGSDMQSMQRVIANVVPFGVPKWTAAGNDVAAAVGAAVDFLPLDKLSVPFDLCMTALAVHAIEGDSAAAVVLSNVLRGMPGRTLLHRRIATSWFVSNLATAAARSRDPAKLPSGRLATTRNSEGNA